MRITKGHLRFSHEEIWNAGERVASCIFNSLLQIKNSERVGYPVDLTAEKWNECLDKILFSFKEISTCYKNDPFEIYFRENLKKEFSDFEVDENNCLIDKIEIPDYVFENSKKYKEKIKEGLNLYSKYYMDLWDLLDLLIKKRTEND